MCPNSKSIERANELKSKTTEYLKFKELIKNQEISNRQTSIEIKTKLMNFFDATEKEWNDWHWQIKHQITDVETLEKFIPLTEQEHIEIKNINQTNRFAIVPYYLSLVTSTNHPIKKLSVPSHSEMLSHGGEEDPMNETNTNPAGSITRRYPDRLIINVTNMCAMYCRHCQRRRLIGECDSHTDKAILDESIEYIKNNPEIRDVLLTGGDALLLSNRQLEYILQRLRNIPTVEIIRIGSRTPVTMPMRITDRLVHMIKKYHPVYLNTHFNHPFEITKESKHACETLSNHGIYVGNQAVLLKGINDDPFTMTYLNQQLLTIRVRPYYIFHAKNIKGTTHFIPKLSDGLKIMDFMRGNTSGLAIPTYIMNAPGGLGKVPLLPEYIIKKDHDTYTIRTWENNIFEYKEK